jgi:SOS-response transcriptional repressor LexA
MAANPHRIFGYRGAQVLAFVRNTIEVEGSAPSYGMICDALGISTKGEVSSIVARLEKRGALSRVGNGRVRRIRLP